MNRTLVGKIQGILLSALLAVACLASSRSASCGNTACVDNGILRIAVDPQCGQLTEFVDIQTGFNHIASRTTPDSLWEMELLVAGKKHRLAAQQARQFAIEPLAAQRKGLRLVWKTFPDDWAKGVKVEATVELQPDRPMSRWTFQLAKPADVLVNEVRYPRILGLAKREREKLAIPVALGEETDDPRSLLCHGSAGKPLRCGGQYPGRLSMQFMAWYGHEGPGLYFACDDSTGMRKSMAAWGSGADEANLEAVHHPENLAAGQLQHEIPYGVRLENFQGDWLTAAKHYQTWALEQP